MRLQRTTQKPRAAVQGFPRSGVYALLISVANSCFIRVGSLGVLPFKRGIYVYVGSAHNALIPRILRHLQRRKKKKWHIDYLTCVRTAHIAAVVAAAAERELECKVSYAIKMKAQPLAEVKQFGSSDCKICTTHLYYFGEAPPPVVSRRIRTIFCSIPAASQLVWAKVMS